MSVLNKIKEVRAVSRYLKYVRRYRASKKIVLLQIDEEENYSKWIAPLLQEISVWGRDIGELYAICPLQIRESVQRDCGSYAKSVQYCEKDSAEYDRLLCKAGCIILDGVLPDRFIKKKKQICVRVGTIPVAPLKNCLGSQQRTLLLCDYIVVASQEHGDQVMRDYYLEQLFGGKLLLAGRDNKWFENPEHVSVKKNGKENVLIYPGGLGENGITRSFYNLISSIDLENRNYYVCFREKYMKERLQAIEALPPKLGIIGWAGDTPMTTVETAAYVLRFKAKLSVGILNKIMDRIYIRESKRRFQSLHADAAVQFAGYEKEMIRIFRFFKGRRIIYVHNDMVAEAKKKGNQDWGVLRDAYQNYDKVAAVAEGIVDPVVKISRRRDNIVIVPNCQDFKSVPERAKQELHLDEWTQCSISENRLREILDGPGEKFLNVGRYSPEKGHQMLIEAFSEYWKTHRQSWLIIIGGEGSCYGEVQQYAQKSCAGERIVLIKSIGNPMPVMKKCDVFVLSSLYEGLPMVFFEADMLNLPIISTDIPGPREFMLKYGGYLTPPTPEGIYKGMTDFHDGKVKALGIDFEEYNQRAAAAFEDLYL